ncbi:MAG TPA: Rpn family recombination-promoting nuclease/putative transposase [Leptolyngbyaceae cyanobacterium]
MKTDSIFYQLFETLPNVLFELIGQPPFDSRGYEFKPVEIKETLNSIDGVFVPAARTRHPIYFAEVEHRFDENFYYRFFTDIFLYLGQNKPNRDWLAVAIYIRRSIEPAVPRPYHWLIESSHVKRVYLDELGETANQSVGLGTIKLIVENEATAKQQAKQVIENVRQLKEPALKQKVWELIETILVWKFPQLKIQELETMFELNSLKQSRLYQEAKQEGKLEAVPSLLGLGLTVEQIAEALRLDIETVKQAAKRS